MDRNGTFQLKVELSKVLKRNEQEWNFPTKSGVFKSIEEK